MGYQLAPPVQINGKTRAVVTDREILFWMNDKDVAIPNDVWTPLPWQKAVNSLHADTVSDRFGLYARPSDEVISANQTFAQTATTVAVGSNGAVLPQATINFGDTSLLASSGFVVIRASTLGGAETIVRYTGKNATQITGASLGTGTLATGDVVRQANVTFERPGSGGPATAEIAWAHNATGVRGLRFRFMDGVFNFPGGTDVRSAAAAASPNALLRSQTTEQPFMTVTLPGLSTGITVEAYQNSGGVLNSIFLATELSAPRIVFANLSPVEISTIS